MGALIKIKHQLKAMKEADETYFFLCFIRLRHDITYDRAEIISNKFNIITKNNT
jgi:hypothetical protein